MADNVRNDATFSFERFLPRDHVLLRAFRIFEERTGRSPFQVQRECVTVLLLHVTASDILCFTGTVTSTTSRFSRSKYRGFTSSFRSHFAFSRRDEADICWLCGAYLCAVHPASEHDPPGRLPIHR